MPNPFQWTEADRVKRRLGASGEDQRQAYQRDRDRILYCSAFRRLAGITQIVRADEADVFHTRQQHSMKVAQVGRRLAEKCIHDQPKESELLGLHPEVVEAACLAHDLGHPPFGHVGEHTLHEKVTEHDPDGFEGNAQSFRILTKLAVRFAKDPGLDLTRATLAAVLKYPWTRSTTIPGRDQKWSAYTSEQADFDFARELFSHSSKTAEAELMDWSDDIAYSVHDLEDFHRCAALPWTRILDESGTERMVERAEAKWWDKPSDALARLRNACRRLVGLLKETFPELITAPYEGTRGQRQQLRTLTSMLIGRYIRAARLKNPDDIEADDVCIDVAADAVDEVRILKQITRDYIIDTPSLAAQQKGQRRILQELFDDLHNDSKTTFPAYLPIRLRYLWDDEQHKARFAADCVASLTESEAIALHARLHGTASGSVLDPIVR